MFIAPGAPKSSQAPLGAGETSENLGFYKRLTPDGVKKVFAPFAHTRLNLVGVHFHNRPQHVRQLRQGGQRLADLRLPLPQGG